MLEQKMEIEQLKLKLAAASYGDERTVESLQQLTADPLPTHCDDNSPVWQGSAAAVAAAPAAALALALAPATTAPAPAGK